MRCRTERSRSTRASGTIPPVRIERVRENVFTVTATGQELSALVAGARLALDAMRASPETPSSAIELLDRVLADVDHARERLAADGDRR